MSPVVKTFTADTLVAVRRLGAFDLSPCGGFAVAAIDELSADGKAYDTNLWRIDLAGRGTQRSMTRLTRTTRKKGQPRFAPDGALGFLSQPDPSLRAVQPAGAAEAEAPADEAAPEDAPQQLHRLRFDGSEAAALTDLATGVASFEWTRDGQRVVLTCPVHPSAKDLADNAAVEKAWKDRKTSGRVFDSYPVRYWDHLYGPKHPHLVVAGVDGTGARDLCTGLARGLEESELDVSPDGRITCSGFTTIDSELRFDSQLVTWDLASGERRALTRGPAHHWAPRWSPDGSRLACLTQHARPRITGKCDIALVDAASGDARIVTSHLDITPTRPLWVDATTLLFSCDERGHHVLRTLDVETGASRALTTSGHAAEIRLSPDRTHAYFALDRMDAPPDLWRVAISGDSAPERLTNLNAELLDGLALSPGLSVDVPGPDGVAVQCWEVRPPGFKEGERYPFLLWIHGGPVHAYLDQFHFRWNAQIYAARGYVVVMANPRGSTGFGQEWIEQNNGDWGNRCYRDLMSVADHYQAKNYVDSSRMAALGASFGGYMVNWLAGHETRFRCLVSHAGLFHLAGFHGTTDCGPEWELEFGGVPWENPELYERWSPSAHAPRFATPTLVIHGELDYRVPLGEGLQMFQALQKRGVPSKFLYFPDENHWILKPANLRLWNETVIDWLDRWLA